MALSLRFCLPSPENPSSTRHAWLWTTRARLMRRTLLAIHDPPVGFPANNPFGPVRIGVQNSRHSSSLVLSGFGPGVSLCRGFQCRDPTLLLPIRRWHWSRSASTPVSPLWLSPSVQIATLISLNDEFDELVRRLQEPSQLRHHDALVDAFLAKSLISLGLNSPAEGWPGTRKESHP